MDLMHDAVDTHIFLVYLFISVMIINFYSVYNLGNFIKLAKRLKFLTPLYHVLNATIIYTGTIVAFYHRTFSFTILIMIAASIAVMVLEIKRFKKMRVIKVADTQLQEEFLKFSRKIYLIEIVIIVLTYIISKIF
jgi:cation transport ATPase